MNRVRRGPITARTPPDHDVAAGEGSRAHVLQCRLPTDLYEWLRLQAFQTRRTMNSIVLAAVRAYRAEMEAGRTMLEGRGAGGGATTTYNVRLDDDRYEWLRTTAFDTRTSINALVVAALVLQRHLIQKRPSGFRLTAAQPQQSAGSVARIKGAGQPKTGSVAVVLVRAHADHPEGVAATDA